MCKLIFFQFVRFCSSEQFWSFPKQTKLCKIPRNYKSPRTWYPVLDAQRQGCVLGASIRSREPKSDTDGEETGDHSSYGLHPLKHDSHTRPDGHMGTDEYFWVDMSNYGQVWTVQHTAPIHTHQVEGDGWTNLSGAAKNLHLPTNNMLILWHIPTMKLRQFPNHFWKQGKRTGWTSKCHTLSHFLTVVCGCVERDENTWHGRTSTPDRVCAQRDMPRGGIVQTLVETSLDLGWVVMCVALIGPELGWGLIRSSPWQGQNSDLKDHFQGSGPNGGTDATSSEILLQKAPQTSVFSR